MKIAYICNVFDPETREDNKINSDSPTAFNKVLSVSKCVKDIGGDISIISMGILNSPLKKVNLRNKIIDNVSIYYFNLPRNKILRNILIQFKLFPFVWNKKYDGLIIYNYFFSYFLLMIISFIRKIKIVVDIEDGINEDDPIVLQAARKCLLAFYLFLSRNKALVVSSLLQKNRHIKRSCIVYGAGDLLIQGRPCNEKISILYSGTILKETGALMLLELLFEISKNKEIYDNVIFNICGIGKMANSVRDLTKDYSFVNCYGYLPDKEYKEMLFQNDIGLVLKLKDISMGQTTFPSKIVEYALSGLAIIAIPSSDIPFIFTPQEVFFVDNAKDIVKTLKNILNNRKDMEYRKELIMIKASRIFNKKNIGNNIIELFNGK